jgi:nucleotide-binding universal stress UspA family protein
MITLKNILVATDFGEASEAALAYGRALARNFGARLHVMHVVGNTLAFAGAEGYAYDAGELQGEMEESARKTLAALIRDDDRRELKAETVLRVSGTPALAIVSYARDANVDLIVMGTHGRGGMAHVLMGSVAEKVVRTAPCPVLTVRHPEHEFVLPDALQVVTHARA